MKFNFMLKFAIIAAILVGSNTAWAETKAFEKDLPETEKKQVEIEKKLAEAEKKLAAAEEIARKLQEEKAAAENKQPETQKPPAKPEEVTAAPKGAPTPAAKLGFGQQLFSAVKSLAAPKPPTTSATAKSEEVAAAPATSLEGKKAAVETALEKGQKATEAAKAAVGEAKAKAEGVIAGAQEKGKAAIDVTKEEATKLKAQGTEARGQGQEGIKYFGDIKGSLTTFKNLVKKPKNLTIGAIVASIFGVLGSVLGVNIDKGVGAKANAGPEGGTGTQPDEDSGYLPPSGYKEPDSKDATYAKGIEDLAGKFANIENLFKQALERNSYYDKSFKIMGQSGSQDFGIIFELGAGAGDLGSAFTPFTIKIIPEQINGSAVMPSMLLEKMSGSAKEFMQRLFKLKAEETFAVKYMLLVNTITDDSSKNVFQRMETILNESALLFSRLIFSTSPLTITSLRTSLPKQFLDLLDQPETTKIFVELIRKSGDPVEVTKLAKKVYEMRKVEGYNEKVAYALAEIIPMLNKDLCYSDLLLAMHALIRITADIGSMIEASDNKESELILRCDNLTNLLNHAIATMKDADFDSNEITYLAALVKMIAEVKSGKRTLDKINKKPLLGEFRLGTQQDVSLTKAMDVCLRNFKFIYNQDNFPTTDLSYGKNGTIQALLSLLLHGVRDVLKAEDFLFNTKDTSVLLRQTDGTNFAINPSTKLEEAIAPAMQTVAEAQKNLLKAVETLRKDPQNSDNQKSYAGAMQNIEKAAQKLLEAKQSFRFNYSIYYPIKNIADDSTQTVAELLQKGIKNISKQSAEITVKDVKTKAIVAVFKDTYKPFEEIFGIPADTLVSVY
jgi:hypothetical protein